jgi:tRNA threonylcarbamoyladenosine modification (KEOPS) complex  Pcc1 subunit
LKDEGASWSAVITVRVDDPSIGDWLERALAPEAAREVPRARARMSRGKEGSVELTIAAEDVGALRAALNTYLGWVQLSLTVVEKARRPPARSSSPA